MDEIFSPFARLWNWVTNLGGFPAQMMFCSIVVILILALVVWFSNRR